MFGVFIRLSYTQLSFCGDWKAIFKVSINYSIEFVKLILKFLSLHLDWIIAVLLYLLWAHLYPGFIMDFIAIINQR